MGTKHAKKRYLVVRYTMKPDKKFDELIELTKKRIGAGKLANASVVLDLHNKKVLKCSLPNIDQNTVPFDNVYTHYRKFYADAIDQFMKD
jgi:hypothetical protein|tara:strand:+ start:681 stop:950 length:270 start_codon:yes stop_codon:yes gene_type:complete